MVDKTNADAPTEAERPHHPLDELDNEGVVGLDSPVSGTVMHDPHAEEEAAFAERSGGDAGEGAEAAQAGVATPTEEQPAEEQPAEGEKTPDEMSAAFKERDATYLKDGRFDIAAFEREFDARSSEGKGGLSPETYAWLEKKGISADIANEVIQARIANNAALTKAYDDIVGGGDEKQKVLEWGRASYSAEEREAFNRIMAGNDVGATKLALKQLRAAYDAADHPMPARQVKGGTVAAAAGYADEAAWQKDKFSADYKRSAAFRREVDAKLMRSAWFNR